MENKEVKIISEETKKNSIWEKLNVLSIIILYPAALIAFLLLGFLKNYWYNAWILFLVPDIIASIFRCIDKKLFTRFSIVFFSTALYFFLNLVVPGKSFNLWVDLWPIFLLIPIYYFVFLGVDKKRHGYKINETIDIEEEEQE